jgi:hypothetical protein
MNDVLIAIIKLQILETYCGSIHRCELRDLSCTSLPSFKVSWCRGLKMLEILD